MRDKSSIEGFRKEIFRNDDPSGDKQGGVCMYFKENLSMQRRNDLEIMHSFNQYSENETKIWRQNILNQFSRVSPSYLRSHFVISLMIQ